MSSTHAKTDNQDTSWSAGKCQRQMSHHFGNRAESRHAKPIYEQLFRGAVVACRNHRCCGVPLNLPFRKLLLEALAEKDDYACNHDRCRHAQLFSATALVHFLQRPEYKPRQGESNQG